MERILEVLEKYNLIHIWNILENENLSLLFQNSWSANMKHRHLCQDAYHLWVTRFYINWLDINFKNVVLEEFTISSHFLKTAHFSVLVEKYVLKFLMFTDLQLAPKNWVHI